MIASPRLAYPTATRRATKAAQGRVLGIVSLLDAWIERYRQRRALLELNDHMLRDIGVSPADAWQEGRKPFWRA
jgi:uncharacterized protein YjiS (DUF1127 family)